MSATCRYGHVSETTDFCDECGAPIGSGAPAPAPSSSTGPAPWSAEPPDEIEEGPAEVCPVCGTPRSGRFCEEDGHDFVIQGGRAAPPAPSPGPAAPAVGNGSPPSSGTGTWLVTVDADRRYYETVVAREGPDIAAVTFPNYYPRAEVPLAGAEVRVGRRRVNGSSPPPQIDLAGPPLDPGVSHLHAVLLPLPDDDGWSVLDPGSTNGTTINYGDDPIALDTVIPLRAGDRVHVGAFTTLEVQRR